MKCQQLWITQDNNMGVCIPAGNAALSKKPGLEVWVIVVQRRSKSRQSSSPWAFIFSTADGWRTWLVVFVCNNVLEPQSYSFFVSSSKQSFRFWEREKVSKIHHAKSPDFERSPPRQGVILRQLFGSVKCTDTCRWEETVRKTSGAGCFPPLITREREKNDLVEDFVTSSTHTRKRHDASSHGEVHTRLASSTESRRLTLPTRMRNHRVISDYDKYPCLEACSSLSDVSVSPGVAVITETAAGTHKFQKQNSPSLLPETRVH